VIVLDTHVLVWLLENDERLGRRAVEAIQDDFRSATVSVSAITFWEVAMLTRRGRLAIPEDIHTWRVDVLRNGISEIAVTGDLAVSAVQLLDFHDDPADRLITATALFNGATLVTADEAILRWRSPLRRIDART